MARTPMRADMSGGGALPSLAAAGMSLIFWQEALSSATAPRGFACL